MFYKGKLLYSQGFFVLSGIIPVKLVFQNLSCYNSAMLIDKREKFEQDFREIKEEERFPQFPLPISVKSAAGSTITDKNGKEYLDLTSNMENNPLGYTLCGNLGENNFLDSELFFSQPSEKLENILKHRTGLAKAVFSSDVKELYSQALKIITSHLNTSNKEKVLISCLSSQKNIYGEGDFQREFIPLNKETILKTMFSRQVGAVIIQPVQPFVEFTVADEEYLALVRELCTKNNALMLIDVSNIAPMRLEIGTFNFDNNIKPDLVLISKGLGQGLPVSALLLSENISKTGINSGEIGVYSSAYSMASDFIENYSLQKLAPISDNIIQKLIEIMDYNISFIDFISYGMIFEIVLDVSAYDFAREAFERGIIIKTLSSSKVIIAPPYNISSQEIEKFAETFKEIFDKLSPLGKIG